MRSFLVGLFVLSVVPAMAQTEIRLDAGFSDTAHWTRGQREPIVRAGTSVNIWWDLRLSGVLTKEGSYPTDGWGMELAVGKRRSLPWHAQGTIGGGLVATEPSNASAGFTAGASDVSYQHVIWRTVRLNSPFVDWATVYPFAFSEFQRPIRGRLFVGAQLRVSRVPVLEQRMTGSVGDTRSSQERTWKFIPGYSIGIGYRF